MKKLKLATILGTRPEIIRLSEVIKCADVFFEHVLIHTGQNYDDALNRIFFEDLGLRMPDVCLQCVGQHLGATIGKIIAETYDVLRREAPDAVLLLGDTNSALAVIAAKRLKIPIFHMEAGNRCWDWNVPEMINRTIVDHIADIHLPYTEHARRYLLGEGLDGKTIFVTGSPMHEVLEKHRAQILKSDILQRLGVQRQRYLLVSVHREENVDHITHFKDLMDAINLMAEDYQLPVLFCVHPRTRNRVREAHSRFHPLVRLLTPLGFLDYNQLQVNSLCVLSDSGTLSEESAMLHFAAVLLRTSTERPEALDSGTIVLGGIKPVDVKQALALAIATFERQTSFVHISSYQEEQVSYKVVKIIQSYAKIVRQTVWNIDV